MFFHLLRWACHVDGRLLVGARRKPIALAGVGFHHRREPDTPEYIQVNGWLIGCSRQVAPWQRMARSPLGKNNQACRGWVEWWVVASFRVATGIPRALSQFPRGPQLSPAKAFEKCRAWRFSPKHLPSPAYTCNMTFQTPVCRACSMASTFLLVHPVYHVAMEHSRVIHGPPGT